MTLKNIKKFPLGENQNLIQMPSNLDFFVYQNRVYVDGSQLNELNKLFNWLTIDTKKKDKEEKISFYFGNRKAGKSVMMENCLNSTFLNLLRMEIMLNCYSRKKYRIKNLWNSDLFSLVEVDEDKKERIIISELSPEKMLVFLQKTIKLTIDESVIPRKIIK